LAVICLFSSLGFSGSLVMKDRMEVGSLSRGVRLPVGPNSYPFRYRMALAFSIFLYPHFHRLALQLAFPKGRNTGLPRFV